MRASESSLVRLNQIHDPDLRFHVGLDVGLGGSKVGVPRQHLDVPERSADRGYLPRCIGYESATPGMTRAAIEANVPVPAPEQVDQSLRGHSLRPLALDQERAVGHADRFGILDEGGPKLLVQRDDPAGLALACPVLQADRLTDLAAGIGDHPPGQAGYLLGSEAGLHRKQEYEPVPGRPTGLGQVTQDGLDLPLAQRLRLFSQSHEVLLTRYFWAAGRWTVTSQERSYIADRK